MMSIVLIRPEIPHNTGAIGRLCVGLGVPLHLVRPLGFALDDRYIAARKAFTVAFDTCQHVYRLMGDAVAKAFSCGQNVIEH